MLVAGGWVDGGQAGRQAGRYVDVQEGKKGR